MSTACQSGMLNRKLGHVSLGFDGENWAGDKNAESTVCRNAREGVLEGKG